VAKSQRLTDINGSVVSTIELDPWGGDTNRSNNSGFQPQRFTSYLRDGNESDEAMMRRYNRWWSRFDQPDPYDGSYDLADPQSLNRYSYTRNDPVNFIDPSGLCGVWATDPATNQPYFIPCINFGGVTTTANGGGMRGGGGGGGSLFDSMFLPEETADGPGGGEGGGGGAPQSPSPGPTPTPPPGGRVTGHLLQT
jgi:RHS repeat-associated protein